MYDIVALGELLMDISQAGLGEDGCTMLAAHPGGAPANVLASAAAMGVSTAMMAKVGQDAFGKELIASLEKAGVNARAVLMDPKVFTTLAFVTLDERGETEFSFVRQPGADTRLRYEDVDLRLIDQCKIFHFGSLSMTDQPARDATVRAVAYAREKGKLISFDPNLRAPLWKDLDKARERMLWGMSRADIVKIGRDEAQFLFDLDPVPAADKLRREYSVKLVFVTAGENGCYYAGPNGSGFVESIPGIKVKDTTGAGDIFTGAALAEILRIGKELLDLSAQELHQIVSFASKAAGLSTTRSGGINSVFTRAEVEAL